MHLNHKLGYANSKTGYCSYYQYLLPHVHEGISNAFWIMSLSKTLSPNKAQYLPLLHRHPSNSETRCPLYKVHQPSVSTLSASRQCSPYFLRVSKYNHVGYDYWKSSDLPNKTFKSLSMLRIGHYPAGVSMMLIYLTGIDTPLVALMPFWSLPYLPKYQIANHSSFAQGVTPKTTQWTSMQSSRDNAQYSRPSLGTCTAPCLKVSFCWWPQCVRSDALVSAGLKRGFSPQDSCVSVSSRRFQQCVCFLRRTTKEKKRKDANKVTLVCVN